MKKQFFYEIILPLLGLIIAGIVSLICSGIKIDWGNFTADPVFELRFIRLIGAFTVGASLALAGMVFQAVLRNQLAEPFTLGISGGAGVGAAAAIILNLPAITLLAVPLSALAGALILLIHLASLRSLGIPYLSKTGRFVRSQLKKLKLRNQKLNPLDRRNQK